MPNNYCTFLVPIHFGGISDSFSVWSEYGYVDQTHQMCCRSAQKKQAYDYSNSLVLHCTSLLCMIFESLVRAHERVHVQIVEISLKLSSIAILDPRALVFYHVTDGDNGSGELHIHVATRVS